MKNFLKITATVVLTVLAAYVAFLLPVIGIVLLALGFAFAMGSALDWVIA